jgi:hypothetical protein
MPRTRADEFEDGKQFPAVETDPRVSDVDSLIICFCILALPGLLLFPMIVHGD